MFLLIGILSCGDDAKGDVKKVVTSKLKEYSLNEVTIPNDTMAFFKKDMKPVTGVVINKHVNNELKCKQVFVNGLRDGELKSWWRNGQLREVTNYKNGIRNGLSTRWFSSGQLWFKVIWRKGKDFEGECYDKKGKRIDCNWSRFLSGNEDWPVS